MLEIHHTLFPIILSIVGTTLLWLILNLVTKNRQKSSVLTSIFIVLFFSYGHVYEVISGYTEKTIGMSSDIYLTLNYLIILVISYILILKSPKKFENISKFLNFTAVILILFPVYTILTLPSNTNQGELIEGNTQLYSNEIDCLQPPENCPDIYYIILDGYARGDVFEEVYNFDNSEFYNELKNLGFVIAKKSRANYSSTLLSLSSSLNMKYHDQVDEDLNIMSNFTRILSEQIANNRVAIALRKIGYRFITFSTGTTWTEIKNSDEYITPKFSFNEFENMIIGTTPLRSLLLFVPKLSPYFLHGQRILFNLEKLSKIGDRQSPVFVFTHLLSPHPPFVFADVSILMDSTTIVNYDDGSYYHNLESSLQLDYKNKYIAQVRFLNIRILETIKLILDKRKESIIIIQSDHGPASLLNWESPDSLAYRERVPILNAFHFPQNLEVVLYDSITPVNTFRLIFNNLFDSNFNLLEDRSYFSKWSEPYSFIPVDEFFISD